MAPKVKEAMGVMSDAIGTACGWAFCAVALYTLLFVNMTGNGTLWDSLRGVALDAPAPIPAHAFVETRLVPVRPAADPMAKAQDRMLLIPGEPEQEFAVPVLAQQQPARDQLTDAPADAKAGKSWRRHLTGTLRTFTVYGNGDERSSASASAVSGRSAPAAPAASAVRPAATPALVASAYRSGIAAAARPGVSDHVSRVDSGAGDGVRNFR